MKNTKEEIKSELMLGDQKLTLSSGKVAYLADAAVLASLGETTVLTTVVSKPTPEVSDFLPLRIDYEERFYAGGTIGGSRFSRREGKPTDVAVINGRLIDHAIRPLFAKDFIDDTQIIVTVLSLDGKNDPMLLAMLTVSAAVKIAKLPFAGPIVPLRISKTGSEYKYSIENEADDSSLEMIVSYLNNGEKVQAVEAHAHIVPETEVLNAIKEGKTYVQPLFAFLEEFTSKFDTTVKDYQKSWFGKEVLEEFKKEVLSQMEAWEKEGVEFKSLQWSQKQEELAASLVEKYEERYTQSQFLTIINEIQKYWIRDKVLNKKERLDKRGFDEIRPLSAEVAFLPRVHGSAVFARGQTQALTVATLASPSKKLLVESMTTEKEMRYIHHYNFPPFSTGEVGRLGGANRREIGHGKLAEKALLAVLPSDEEFPYMIRLVTEILTSNGSTSMAATCGSSLALMDAGVPIKSHVAGIGVGLFVDETKDEPDLKDYVLLTDIVGDEDFAGYMDFKMTGTDSGMTAIQMELKLQGIPLALLGEIFEKSITARKKVLEVMIAAIAAPREHLSQYAPKMEFVKIELDEIGQLIGTGGATIKALMEEFEVEIDIDEKEEFGLVAISGVSQENIDKTKETIELMFKEVEIGQVYEGKVTRIEPYGAFVEILPKKIGLMHVSEYDYSYVKDLAEFLKIGDTVKVKVTGLEDGKISVSKKALETPPPGYEERSNSHSPSNNRNYNNRHNNSSRRGGNRNYNRNDRNNRW